MKNRKGFSLIELLLVIGIIAILATISVVSLIGRKGKTELDGTAKQIVAVLREAQSRSAAQASGAAWGVYFSNATSTAPFYALFSGTYSTSSRLHYYRLPSAVSYATSSLASGATTSITFSQLTGLASASTSIRIYIPSQTSLSSTIYIASSGLIRY